MALLIHNRAQFVTEMTDIHRRYNGLKEETAKRLANIEALLIQHNRLVNETFQRIKAPNGDDWPIVLTVVRSI